MAPSRILVLSPHPDDEAIGSGGTIRAHADQGDEVHVVYLTSGEKGGHGLPELAVRTVREREALRACAVLGVSAQEFWRLPDGRLRAAAPVVARLRALLRRLRPSRVYAPNAAEAHPDHRAATRLLRRALGGVRTPECLLYEVWTPLHRLDAVVDITAHVDAKRQAVRAYRSQCRVLRFDDASLGLARWRGEMFCWPKGEDGRAGRYAECFTRLVP